MHHPDSTGEQKRPCSGLVRVTAHPKPSKVKKPSWQTARVTDWIGGLCPVDTLHVWFPAHWACRVIRRLHEREQEHREAHPAWFDLPGVSENLRQKQKEAKAAREMSLKIANFGASDVPTNFGSDRHRLTSEEPYPRVWCIADRSSPPNFWSCTPFAL